MKLEFGRELAEGRSEARRKIECWIDVQKLIGEKVRLDFCYCLPKTRKEKGNSHYSNRKSRLELFKATTK